MNRGGSGDDGGGSGKERRLCVFGNRHATNKQHMPNNQIPLHSVPVHSAEHSGPNSGMPQFRRNDQALE